MRGYRWMLPVVVVSVITGCATIFTGTKEDVSFQSNPSDAEVIIDGTSRGRTPLTLSLAKKNSYTVTFKKECYAYDEKLYVTRTMQMGWAILDWISFPFLYIPLGVDWLTGAWYTFDKNNVSVDLTNTCAGESKSGSGGEGESGDGSSEKSSGGDGQRDCSEQEKCDGKDNDCDGVVDENC